MNVRVNCLSCCHDDGNLEKSRCLGCFPHYRNNSARTDFTTREGRQRYEPLRPVDPFPTEKLMTDEEFTRRLRLKLEEQDKKQLIERLLGNCEKILSEEYGEEIENDWKEENPAPVTEVHAYEVEVVCPYCKSDNSMELFWLCMEARSIFCEQCGRKIHIVQRPRVHLSIPDNNDERI
jgi:hypothetical protein